MNSRLSKWKRSAEYLLLRMEHPDTRSAAEWLANMKIFWGGKSRIDAAKKVESTKSK